VSTPDTDIAVQRAGALADLVESRLPLEVDVTGPGGRWAVTGGGLLAHATGSLHAISRLQPAGMYNDAFRLLRSLYDHVVTLAWLAEDQVTRLTLWRLEDLKGRLTLDREASSAGRPLLDGAERTEMSRALGGVSVRMPTLAAMAIAADRYWEPRLDFLQPSGPQSFGGLYTFLFRNYSGLVHASFRGLNRVTEDISDHRKRIVVQAPLETNGPCSVATVVYGIGLYVAAQALGWPAANEVSAAFERFPVAAS
jgi:hypothetical protein